MPQTRLTVPDLPDLTNIAAVFLMGLFGSAHCLGMCGGFSVMAGRAGWWPAYGIGKTLTYALLGALAGLLGHALFVISVGQQALSIVAGLALVVIGAATAGLIPDRLVLSGPLLRRIGPLLGRAMGHGRLRGPMTVGALNGLLPCGLVYAALMKSMEAAGTLPSTMLMAIFGMATLPGLALLALLEERLSAERRRLIARSGGWLVVLIGAITIWRAFQTGGH